MAIEEAIARRFLGKVAMVIRRDNSYSCRRGVVAEVTTTTLILEHNGTVEAIALEAIENIREVIGCPR
jgi:hypothetical protein